MIKQVYSLFSKANINKYLLEFTKNFYASLKFMLMLLSVFQSAIEFLFTQYKLEKHSTILEDN